MFLEPVWPAPKNIKAYSTLRIGGMSQAPYDQFNLAEDVGDNPKHVLINRELLKTNLQLPTEPIWLNQTHSTIAIKAIPAHRHHTADASYSDQPNHICLVQTADCLPILLCHQQGTHIAAIHAGWRGLLHGIIESTLQALALPPEELLVWLGPAISQTHFEVGEEVRTQFIDAHPESKQAFIPSPNQRWLADLYALARIRLLKQGIKSIYGGEFCTYSDPNLFYSYRRDGAKTGRMMSLIWIND